MVANTDQTARASSLCATAIKLVQQGNRTIEQKQSLFTALQEFTDEKSFNTEIKYAELVYPGRFGNRCAGCNSYIDDGGCCNGGTDHWAERPGACGTKETKTMSIFEQLETLTHLCSATIKMIRNNHNQMAVNQVLAALQDFKDGRSAKEKQTPEKSQYPGCFNGNRCAGCGGFIDSGGTCPCGWDHDRKIKMA
ncbi:MAG: hypothetical protein GF365_02665 [Candidatus Buchananbacteria bacterium]|nr:hypothetical protein [Candidatus Buchananbacteria bacterium]